MLDVSDTLIDDDSIDQIARLPSLASLDLGGTKITNRALEKLANFEIK